MLQVGRIQNVHLPKDRVTQSHQGYGFVEFSSEEDAEYAAKIMNQIRLYGKPIRVNKASADKQKSAEIGAELFIGNLDPMVTEQMLFDTFNRFGGLTQMPKVARDENGLSKGYGFVSFSTFESSDNAIMHMNGQFMANREVSVQYAYKKDGKGERHGDEAERQLARQAQLNNVSSGAQPFQPPQAPTPVVQAPPTPVTPQAPPVGYGMPNGYPPQVQQYRAPPPQMPLPAPPAGLPARPPPANAGYGGPPGFTPQGFAPPPPGFPGAPPMPPGFGQPLPPGFAPPR